MLIKIKCPKCGIDSSMSLVEPDFHGPFKCWKCRELFTLEIENNEVKSCEPLSPEELRQQQELEALKAKFRRNR